MSRQRTINSLTKFNLEHQIESTLDPGEKIFGLSGRDDNLDTLIQTFHKQDTDPSCVVSMIGDTHEGKSEILSSLLNLNVSTYGKPQDEIEHLNATG